MSAFVFTLVAIVAVIVLGSIIFGGNGPAPPPRGSYHSSTPIRESSSALSDELAGVEDAQKLREEARRNSREMLDAYNRAKTAQQRGLLGAAKEHRQRGNAHKSSMEYLDKRAAEIIFREKNKNRKGGMIDLHGLLVAEAIQIAKDQVETGRSRGDKVVHFIVGKGLHANDGEAKIRPALQVLFTKQGLAHSLDSKNSGVLIVQL